MKPKILAVAAAFLLTACGGDDSPSTSIPETPPVPAPVPPPTNSYDFESVRESMRIGLLFNPGTAVSVAVLKDSEIIFSESRGENAPGAHQITTDTQFQIGSTQKVFTALGILKLVEQGQLSVDDELLAHLPDMEYPTGDASLWANIQIHELLSQQSGLLDWNDFNTELVGTDLQDFVLSGYPQFSPMSDSSLWFSYSNPNYVYAGAIIERLTGTDFATWMKGEVFTPLQMNQTTMFRTSVAETGNFALPADVNGEYLTSLEEVPADTVGLSAGTGTWSTPSDMLKMADFLLNGNEEIVSSEIRNSLYGRHVLMDELGAQFRSYGYGLMVKDGILQDMDTYYPIEVWEHGGGTDYYSSKFYIFPEHNVAVSILANNEDADHEEIMLEILRTLELLPNAQQAPLEYVDETRFPEYVGTYRGKSLWGDLTVNVSITDGLLLAEVPNLNLEQNEYDPVLIPLAGQTFLLNSESLGSHTFTFRDLDDETGMDVISGRTMVLYRNDYQQ